MTRDISSLEKLLADSPEDWSVRITLIEEQVRRQQMGEARKLVRESPDDSPLPHELQYRLHTLMTQGVAAVEALEPVADYTPARTTDHNRDRQDDPPAKEPPPVPPRKSSPESPEQSGDSNEEKKDPDDKSKLTKRTGPAVTMRIDLEKMRRERQEKWEDYDDSIHLEKAPRPSSRDHHIVAAQKVSAFSSALLVHIITFFLLGFIVVTVPRQRPPQLIATLAQESDVDLAVTRLTKMTDPRPAAASASPVNVIGSTEASAFSIPEMDKSPSLDVTTLITGLQPTGQGLSYTGDARQMSDVNFFGISAGGKRIVFIIDATPFMLVDEKGGMYAYNKVKDEIGQMLASLNRGTHFNILLYEGKRVVAFREEPVIGLPSNLRRAIEWLDPLNRTYEELGLQSQDGTPVSVSEGIEPIKPVDVAHYTKPIQKALEWRASTVFCIASGYRQIGQSPDAEMLAKYVEERKKNPGTPGTPGQLAPGAREQWNQAIQKTREWLRNENSARAEKGLPPKVVINFNQLVREVTGQTPPRRTGGTPGTPGARFPNQPPHTPEDIELQVKNSVKKHFREKDLEPPSVHMVVFAGEDEEINDQTKDHFRNLTRKNNGKLKILRGLAMLEDVTSKN